MATWINPNLIKQDQVQQALYAFAKLQLQLLSKNSQTKDEILETIEQLRNESLFKDSSEKDVSTILSKMSGMSNILEQITAKTNLKIQNQID